MTTRTIHQNASIHKWCELMAEELNKTPSCVQNTVTIPIEWTKENFKTEIWKKVQAKMFPETVDEKGNISTTKLDTKQVSEVYEQVNKIMGNMWEVSMPFPSHESELNESLIK